MSKEQIKIGNETELISANKNEQSVLEITCKPTFL
jgi:hypothetical protein